MKLTGQTRDQFLEDTFGSYLSLREHAVARYLLKNGTGSTGQLMALPVFRFDDPANIHLTISRLRKRLNKAGWTITLKDGTYTLEKIS